MTTHITFRLPDNIVEVLDQYQARHKFKSRAEALCKIIEEWEGQDSKKDVRIKELENQLKKKVEVESSVPSSPQEVSSSGDKEVPLCNYATSKGNLILCGKDFAKKSKIHEVPLEFCIKCWSRREWAQDRKAERIYIPQKNDEKRYCPFEGDYRSIALTCSKCPPHRKIECEQVRTKSK